MDTGKKFNEMTLADIMHNEVLTAEMTETVSDVVKKMAIKGIGAIVVQDKEEKPIGIFSERDLVKKVIAFDKDPAKTPVTQEMTKDPQTLPSTTPFLEGFRLMQKFQFRHIPVVDNNKLIGIVSIRDVINIIQKEMDDILFSK